MISGNEAANYESPPTRLFLWVAAAVFVSVLISLIRIQFDTTFSDAFLVLGLVLVVASRLRSKASGK